MLGVFHYYFSLNGKAVVIETGAVSRDRDFFEEESGLAEGQCHCSLTPSAEDTSAEARANSGVADFQSITKPKIF